MKRLILLPMLLCMAVLLPSCGSDDEPGDTSIVEGTWVGDDYDRFYSNVTITFKSNGTGSATIDHYGSYSSVRRAEFTYKVKGSKVTTKGTISSGNSDGEGSVSDFNNTYEVKGNTLNVTGGNDWYTSRVYSYRKSR